MDRAEALDTGVFTELEWDDSRAGRSLDLDRYTETFSDDFDVMSISDREGPGPWFGGTRAGYGDARFVTSGPFSIDDPGILTIRAERASDGKYVSGFIQTVDIVDRGFLQSMGYFEIRARFPTGAGFWPAFWLHSRVGSGYPRDTGAEIDVIEWYGGDPKGLHQSLHLWPARLPAAGEPTTHMATSNYAGRPNNGVDTAFHTYGVEITDSWVIFYFDRREVTRHPTLPQLKAPLYPIVSLSVYDKAIAPQSGEMKVDYVKVFARDAPGQRAFKSMLVNGTFEIGNLSYWGLGGAVALAVDTTPVGESKVGQFGPAAASASFSVKEEAPADATYRVTALARLGAEGETASLFATYTNPAGVVRKTVIPVTSTDYQRIAFDLAVPAGYDKARIGFSKQAGTSYAYLDDLTLEKQIFPLATDPPMTTTVTGTGAADLIVGGDGEDLMNGGDGADQLDGGGGADRMAGNGGDDVYVVDDAGDQVIEMPGEGYDLVKAFISYALPDNVEALRLMDRAGLSGNGNDLDNRITGSAHDDRLGGLGGDDLIEAGYGDDLLDGGSGADHMSGGPGDDIYVVDDPGDAVIELAGAGADTVRSSITYALPAAVETLLLTGSADIDGSGNAAANAIRGNAGANILTGGPGDDVIEGGPGADRLDGGEGSDTLSFAGSTAGVRVDLRGRTAVGDVIAGFENLQGSAFADRLVGDNAGNRIDGGDGNDLIVGGKGRDVLAGGRGADRFMYLRAADSKGRRADVILDFSAEAGDRIDLSRFDGDTRKKGRQRFSRFLGSSKFTGRRGELRFARGILTGDSDGDRRADFKVLLKGVRKLPAKAIRLR